MTAPQLIRGPWPHDAHAGTRIELEADRSTLLKRRWRGVAKDGREFGFDLETPLAAGAAFFADEACHYIIVQKPEPVLEITLHDPTQAARIAWTLGNLHFPIEVRTELVLVVDDPAVRVQLERDRVAFTKTSRVFSPIKAAGHHHHEPGEHHHGH